MAPFFVDLYHRISNNSAINLGDLYKCGTLGTDKKSAELLLFLKGHFLAKYAKNGHFWQKKCPSNRTWCPIRVRFALFGYVFDNNWAKNLGLIRDRSVTKLPKNSAHKLFFLFQLDRVKVRAIFHFFEIFVFLSFF